MAPIKPPTNKRIQSLFPRVSSALQGASGKLGRMPWDNGQQPATSNGALTRVQVGANRWITKKDHDELLSHLLLMIAPHVTVREQLVTRYSAIVEDLAGYMKLTKDSEELAKRAHGGESTAVPDQKYPLASGPIEDMITHVLTILFPPRQMYGSVELDKDKQTTAAAFASVLNEHARLFNHYTNMGKMVFDALVYNLGAIECEWTANHGYLMSARNQAGLLGSSGLLFEGNAVKHLDAWNLILDYTTQVSNYGANAEFYATIENVSRFNLLRDMMEKKLYAPLTVRDQLRQIVKAGDGYTLADPSAPFYPGWNTAFGFADTTRYGVGLYKRKPAIRSQYMGVNCGAGNTQSGFNLANYMNGDTSASEAAILHANEKLVITARIIPSEWKLSPSKEMEIWRFVIVNGTWIMLAEQTAVTHGILPIGVTAPVEDFGAIDSKSYGEKLLPFQNLMSNTFNLYINGMRKNVNNGIVLYDPRRVDLQGMKNPTTGWVPVINTLEDRQHNRRVSDSVHVINDHPEINTAIADINAMKSMMQDVVPTDLISRMADLDRAVDHQSRTVSNAASRRMFRLARVISEQAITPISYMQTQNIYHFQKEMTVLDSTGNAIVVQPDMFRQAGVQVAISDGLRGIDTVSISNRIAEIIRYALQSRRIQSELDVVKMVRFLLSIEGATIDINQFRYDTPFDALDDQQKQMAYQLLQQALAQQGQQTQNAQGERVGAPSAG